MIFFLRGDGGFLCVTTFSKTTGNTSQRANKGSSDDRSGVCMGSVIPCCSLCKEKVQKKDNV